jgi:hypothetical protein
MAMIAPILVIAIGFAVFMYIARKVENELINA